MSCKKYFRDIFLSSESELSEKTQKVILHEFEHSALKKLRLKLFTTKNCHSA